MENNIYDILNEIEVDLNEYNNEEFTDIEKQKIKKSTKKFIKKNKPIYRKYIAVACCLILVTTLFATPLGSKALAYTHTVISNFCGIEKDLVPYTSIINKEISKNGISVKLNEVIINDNTVIISSTITTSEKMNEAGILALSNIIINNKFSSIGCHGGAKVLDDYTYESVKTYTFDNDLPSDLSGDLSIKYVLNEVRVNNKDIKGPWIFEFSANGDELATDTIKIPLNYSFTLENNKEITLTNYTSNNIGQKIYFTLDSNGTEYDMILKGQDDLGTEIRFDLSSVTKKEGVFKISGLSNKLPDTAKSITLIPYAVKFPETSGKLSNDFKPVGEEFTIDLVK